MAVRSISMRLGRNPKVAAAVAAASAVAVAVVAVPAAAAAAVVVDAVRAANRAGKTPPQTGSTAAGA